MKVLSLFVLSLLISTLGIAQPAIDQQAYEIALPDVNGDTVRLSSLKGKFVLVDFWASWCGPCRISNKKLVKMYPRLQKKGLEILGVSLDDNEKSWRKAIDKDKVSWKQVISKGGWYSATAEQWKVEQLPTSFLLDRDGKVIAKDPDLNDLENYLKKI